MPLYLILIVAAVIAAILIISNVLYGVYQNHKRKQALLRTYGLPREIVDDPLSVDCIASYWRYRKNSVRSSIDRTTWADLDMDLVFSAVNHTCSSLGEEFLYAMLHEPDTEGNRTEQLEAVLHYFDTHEKEREQVRYLFAVLGKFTTNGIVDFLFKPKERSLRFAKWYPLFSILAVSAIVGLVLFRSAGFPFFLVITLANIIIYFKTSLELEASKQSVGYLFRMVKCAKKLAALKADFPGQADLKRQVKPLRLMGPLVGVLSAGSTSNDTNFIWEYIRLYFLVDFLAYGHLIRMLQSFRKEFINIYTLLGHWDAAISILSYRRSVPFYTRPVFHPECALDMENLIHPLLKQPVSNTACLMQNALVTGSNASGKSTFIKAVAINVILAQTIHTSLAQRFALPHCAVVSSMAVQDNVVSGESYYIAEIRSLKRVFDQLMPDLLTFCVVDEILKGTNTVERIAASASILRVLHDQNCFAVVATHDIELTEMLSPMYANYHFEETVTDNGIVFDYQLRCGRATTKNAIKLLHFMGYDQAIVQRATQLAENFEKNRTWEKP